MIPASQPSCSFERCPEVFPAGAGRDRSFTLFEVDIVTLGKPHCDGPGWRAICRWRVQDKTGNLPGKRLVEGTAEETGAATASAAPHSTGAPAITSFTCAIRFSMARSAPVSSAASSTSRRPGGMPVLSATCQRRRRRPSWSTTMRLVGRDDVHLEECEAALVQRLQEDFRAALEPQEGRNRGIVRPDVGLARQGRGLETFAEQHPAEIDGMGAVVANAFGIADGRAHRRHTRQRLKGRDEAAGIVDDQRHVGRPVGIGDGRGVGAALGQRLFRDHRLGTEGERRPQQFQPRLGGHTQADDIGFLRRHHGGEIGVALAAPARRFVFDTGDIPQRHKVKTRRTKTARMGEGMEASGVSSREPMLPAPTTAARNLLIPVPASSVSHCCSAPPSRDGCASAPPHHAR